MYSDYSKCKGELQVHLVFRLRWFNHGVTVDRMFYIANKGEQEAAWLNEAGYGFVVNAIMVQSKSNGKDLSEDDIEALTATLTSHQAAVVKRRVDTLNATIRKKQKQSNKTDVRDIFKTKSWEGYGASPRHGSDEVDGIRGKNAERYSFTKNKGGYSMSDVKLRMLQTRWPQV
ncbi:ARHGAP18_28_40 [Mytilus edulis]|uniref:ARHGAP18_28_40 n=1 Tax=Mytilus edulis TaxID=6550 RepID=A0A8S3UHF7_MYTED|nr:ARHGAP18_28_40 [Mytilus edulis]